MSHEALVPLTVALPLITAALLAAVGTHLPRFLPDAVAALCAAAVAAMGLVLLLRSDTRTIVYWFGGWRPHNGFAPGIDFSIDPIAASEAVLAAVVVLAALLFSWGHFEKVRHLFYALMLCLLAGMVGFVLSGDLFNIFVFFELMSISAYALAGYRVERPSVIQGAMNFAALNSIGAFCMLMGIALLYGSTGRLNLVDIGTQLARHHPGGLLVGSFTLITVGFLVKAGAAPFHFWLSDAYSVATAPVAAMFTAVMSDLAYDVYSRVYTTVFAPAIADHDAVRRALLALAVLSAVVGAVMCVLQADLKRQLAFLTVSTGGAVLAGIALLDRAGLAGSGMLIVTGGLVRGALMLGLGMVVYQLGGHDELSLRGKGRAWRHLPVAALVIVCAVGLAAPGLGPFWALSAVYDAAARTGYPWVAPVLAACLAVSAGAVLRASARIFFGWGAARDAALTRLAADREDSETSREHHANPRRQWALVPAFGLVAAGWSLGWVPHIAGHALQAAGDLQDQAAQARLVLTGVAPSHGPLPTYRPSAAAWSYGSASLAGAVLVAAVGLWWQRLGALLGERGRRWLLAPISAIKAIHSGSVGDYASWILAGTVALALAWAGTLR